MHYNFFLSFAQASLLRPPADFQHTLCMLQRLQSLTCNYNSTRKLLFAALYHLVLKPIWEFNASSIYQRIQTKQCFNLLEIHSKHYVMLSNKSTQNKTLLGDSTQTLFYVIIPTTVSYYRVWPKECRYPLAEGSF